MAEKILRVPLEHIVGFVGGVNTRDAISTLSSDSYCVFPTEKTEESDSRTPLVTLVFGESANEASRGKFCKLLKDHEPDLAGMAQTILNPDIGLRDPIEVKQLDKSKYLLVDGCRRFLAQTYAWITLGAVEGGGTVKAVVVEEQDDACHTISVVKNTQRRGMTPLEEARQYYYYHKTLGMSDSHIAALFGLTGSAGRQRVYNYRQLVKLTEADQQAVDEGHMGIVAALEKLRGKPKKDKDEKPNGQRSRTLTFRKAKALFDNLDGLKEKVAYKGYDLEAVRFGMALVMQLEPGKQDVEPPADDHADEMNESDRVA